ncbi:hypothetical protein [Nannocystis pusilla]|uniref:hypothetical protein n=1 Tax=Nannocystis pusilla TaxID=889268 RepID=UPI003B7E26BF
MHLQICGSLDLERARQMLDRVGQVLRETGRAYLLADLTQLNGIPHDSRRAIGEWAKTHHATAAALYGANFAMRTVTSLLFKPCASSATSTSTWSSRATKPPRAAGSTPIAPGGAVRLSTHDVAAAPTDLRLHLRLRQQPARRRLT